MANRILSPDCSLSLIILRALASGIRPCQVYCPYMWKRSLSSYHKVIELYRSKGFSFGEIEKVVSAELSPAQVYYVIRKDKQQQEEQKKKEELHKKFLEHRNLWSDMKVTNVCVDVKMNQTISQA